MEGANNPSLFANDGSFLERFKQLQERTSDASRTETDSSKAESVPAVVAGPESSKSAVTVKKTTFSPLGVKPSIPKPAVASNGKFAFSLKQKSKLVANPLKLSEDDDEEEEPGQSATDRRPGSKKGDGTPAQQSPEHAEPTPPPPTDPEVKKVADKLASFVVRHGRQFEEFTRQKNPGDTPFRFLFDINCRDYIYYNHRVSVEEKALATEASTRQNLQAAATATATVPRSASHQSKVGSHNSTNYQTPASALYAGSDDGPWSQQPLGNREAVQAPLASADSIAMMEFYMKKAAQEDLRKPAKRSRDEMSSPSQASAPAPAPAPAPAKKGHHMGDYIPPEELEKFLSKCNDAMAQKLSRESAERAKIQSDNVGHRLLSKMGWKEGEGLGSGKGGRADPVEAGAVKLNNLGVGAEHPGDVNADDDIYEQYKKRMMLGYRFRPNPLNNPRKAYY